MAGQATAAGTIDDTIDDSVTGIIDELVLRQSLLVQSLSSDVGRSSASGEAFELVSCRWLGAVACLV
jgi:hypothetical protein